MPKIEASNCPGIYFIYNLTTGWYYIGKSTKCRRRLGWHLSQLRAGRHYCRKLQTAWNQDKKENFTFKMLHDLSYVPEINLRYMLRYAEVFWLNQHNGYVYNEIGGGGGAYKFSKESCERISKAQIARFQNPSERLRSRETSLQMHKNNPHVREAVSKSTIKRNAERWADPANHEKQSIKSREAQSSPEYQLAHSIAITESWKKTDHREHRVDGILRSWEEGSEGRINRVEALQRSWDEGKREGQNSKPWSEDRSNNHRTGVTNAWNDPIKRANILTGLRRRGKGGNKPRKPKT